MLLICALTFTVASAQGASKLIESGSLRARAYVKPEGEVAVGQQVRLFVEVATDTWLTKAPRYPDIDLDGAIALQPAQSGGSFSERESGKTYSGVRRTYLIYPQRAGSFAIAPLRLTFSVAVDTKPTEVAVSTEPVRFTAIMPVAAAELLQFVTSSKLSVSERYDPEPEGLRVGDAITRTVTIRADDALSLLLPEIRFDAVDGLQAYPAQPALSDNTERGRYRGERVDAVTYVLERRGEFELPAIELHWWQPDNQVLHTETLPAVRFSVAPNAAVDTKTEALPQRVESWASVFSRWGRAVFDWLVAHVVGISLVLGGVYVVASLWRRYRPGLTVRWDDYRQRSKQSERTYFRKLRWVCWSDEDSKIVARLWRWLDSLPSDTAVNGVRDLAAAGDAPEFAEYWRAIEARRYGSARAGRGVVGRELLSRVSRARRRLLKRSKRVPAERSEGLNPTAGS